MEHCLREVQLANMLGYTEMDDFRRAVKAGKVPSPNGYLEGKKRPIWLRSDVEAWLGIEAKEQATADVYKMIKGVA